jgi:hypothetical protein
MKFLVLLSFAVGCATVKDIKGPDGTTHKLIYCGYIESCYADATKACGKYKIVNSSSEAEKDVNGNISNNHTILVKCEEGPKL